MKPLLFWFGSTHWGRVTNMYVSKLTIIDSDNGLSPGRRQAIIWTNAGILLTGSLTTNFSEILIKIYTFSSKNIFENIVWNMAAMLPWPYFVNSLKPSDAIWWQRTGSTLAQVMACCLTAPSHYLNQCWLIISKVLWHSCEDNFTRDTSAINHQI